MGPTQAQMLQKHQAIGLPDYSSAGLRYICTMLPAACTGQGLLGAAVCPAPLHVLVWYLLLSLPCFSQLAIPWTSQAGHQRLDNVSFTHKGLQHTAQTFLSAVSSSPCLEFIQTVFQFKLCYIYKYLLEAGRQLLLCSYGLFSLAQCM